MWFGGMGLCAQGVVHLCLMVGRGSAGLGVGGEAVRVLGPGSSLHPHPALFLHRTSHMW